MLVDFDFAKTTKDSKSGGDVSDTNGKLLNDGRLSSVFGDAEVTVASIDTESVSDMNHVLTVSGLVIHACKTLSMLLFLGNPALHCSRCFTPLSKTLYTATLP